MVYMGSLVESGEGKAVVTAIGRKTEAGKIAVSVLQAKEEKTPLQKKLAHFGKIIGMIISFTCLSIFLGGVLRGGGFLEMFEASVAIAVGGIPEALPVVMTVILVMGMERILKKRGLIRKLSSVETLGSTSVICLDKTRTLTKGEMRLSEVLGGNKDLVLKIAVLCNEAFVENPEDPVEKWRVHGSPTDRSLILGAAELGVLEPELEKRSEEVSRLPFNSENKYKLSLRKEKDNLFLYIVGAPERILERSVNKNGWEEELKALSKKGLRVIGVGYRKIKNEKFRCIGKEFYLCRAFRTGGSLKRGGKRGG